jgi:hypothetical protein
MFKRVLGLVVMVAMLSIMITSVIAQEADTEVWGMKFGAGRFCTANLDGQFLQDMGTVYYADFLPPFKVNIVKEWEVNTKLLAMQSGDDFYGGGALSVKGVTFFTKDINQITLSAGADPALMINGSEIYRELFEDEEFNFNEVFKFGAIIYLEVAF